jgi:predicted RNase H-like HicB family nuclease
VTQTRVRRGKYLVIIEKGQRGFSAYLPDLPGCVAAAGTRRAVEKLMREAVPLHVSGLRSEGEPVPAPRAYSTYVAVRA